MLHNLDLRSPHVDQPQGKFLNPVRSCLTPLTPAVTASQGQKELASRLLTVEPRSLFGSGAIALGLFVVAGADAMRGFSKIRLADNTTTTAAAAAEEEDDFDCIEAILADAGAFRGKARGIVGADLGLNSAFSCDRETDCQRTQDASAQVSALIWSHWWKGGGTWLLPGIIKAGHTHPNPSHPPPLLGNSRRFPPLMPITLRAAICLEWR